MKWPVPTIAILAASALLFACSGKPAARADLPTTVPGPSVNKGSNPSPPPATPPAARAFDESLLRGHEYLLEAPSRGLAPARDSVVGELSREEGPRALVESFFQQVNSGTLDAEIIVPRWKEYLISWAQRASKDGLTEGSVKLGKSLPETQGVILFPVRILGKQNQAKGWVALQKMGEQWLISDAQLVAIPPRTGPFDPEDGG